MTTIDTTATATDSSTAAPKALRWAKPAGFAYVAAWVGGLTAFGAGPGAKATHAEIARYFADHRAATALQALCIHGLAGLALLIVVVGMTHSGASTRLARGAGLTAVGLSLAQFGLDLYRSLVSTGTTTVTLVHAIDRIDGFKMFALAAMIAASIPVFLARRLIGHKMAITGKLAAAALVLSGIGYATATKALAPAADLSLVLLLVWVGYTGTAIARRSH